MAGDVAAKDDYLIEFDGEERIVGQWGLRCNQPSPRGGGPWVSVLIPTRGRPDLLLKIVQTLYFKSQHREKVEYVFRVDEDDGATRRMLADGDLPTRTIITGPRGDGYLDLHKHFVAMANQAKGDWFFCINDDVVMLTEGWEQPFSGLMGIVGKDGDPKWFGCPDGIFALVPFINGRPHDQEFIAVHRRVFEVLGHFGETARIDDWAMNVFGSIGRKCRCHVYIDHALGGHPDKSDDDAKRGMSKETAYALTGTSSAYWSRLADSAKLLEAIDKFNGRGMR